MLRVHQQYQGSSVGMKGVPGGRLPAGAGYVVIPSDVPRAEYIQHCLSLGKVCILTEFGEFFRDVDISEDDLDDIDFPEDYTTFGSGVLWMNMPKHNQPVIVSVIQRKEQAGRTYKENTFHRIKTSKNGIVSISGDADDGFITISVKSFTGDGGVINLDVQNKDGDAEVNVNAKGSVNVFATNKVKIKSNKKVEIELSDKTVDDKTSTIFYEKGVGYNLLDEFGNEIITKNKLVAIISKETDVGSITMDELEWVANGETNKSIIDEIIDILSSATVSTALGPQPFLPDTITKLQKLKTRVGKEMLSKSVKAKK